MKIKNLLFFLGISFLFYSICEASGVSISKGNEMDIDNENLEDQKDNCAPCVNEMEKGLKTLQICKQHDMAKSDELVAKRRIDDKMAIRAVLGHYWKKKLTPQAAIEINDVEGHGTVSESTAIEWFKRFNYGDTSLDDQPSFRLSLNVADELPISVGDQKFVVSAKYLKQISPVFQAMLSNGWSETSERKIEIQHWDPEQFRTFLEAISPNRRTLPNAATVHGLLAMADYYEVQLLKNSCEEYLMNCVMNVDYAAIPVEEHLALAEQYGIEELKNRCEKYLLNSLEIPMEERLALANKYGLELLKLVLLQSSNRWDTQREAPTWWLKSNAAKISGRILFDYSRLIGWHNEYSGPAFASANMTIPQKRFEFGYFEISLSTKELAAIGAREIDGSYAYRYWNNGKIYYTTDSAESIQAPIFRIGDTIGCGVNKATKQVIFTKNGVRVGVCNFHEEIIEVYPTIYLYRPGDKIEANFGQRPFLYDLTKELWNKGD